MYTVGVVGHCNFDGPRLVQLAEQLDDVEAISFDSSQSVEDHLHSRVIHLLLVNREFTNGESGLDVIKTMHAQHPNVKVMLISNFEDAQATAEQLGALKGFGKAALNNPASLELIKSALNT